jgi:hypothetical protein
MPRPNRVTPLGELIATPARGLVYGNRGCLHDANGEIRRRYPTKRWIACQLEFRGRRRHPLMAPGRFTELFFLDEATALAAGHRPCAECRHADYRRLTDLWGELHPHQRGADAIDEQIQDERILTSTRERRLHQLPFNRLPDGVLVVHDGTPHLVIGDRLAQWSPSGYTEPIVRPRNALANVITPPSLIALLRTDYRPLVPLLHPSARILR